MHTVQHATTHDCLADAPARQWREQAAIGSTEWEVGHVVKQDIDVFFMWSHKSQLANV